MQGNINYGGNVDKQIYIENPVDLDGYYIRVVTWFKSIQQTREKGQISFIVILLFMMGFLYIENFFGIRNEWAEILLFLSLFIVPLVFFLRADKGEKLLAQELCKTVPQLALIFSNDKKFIEIESIYCKLKRKS